MARAENPEGELTSEPQPRRARGGSVTLRDVARFAGVSSATVSRVMNNPDAVSEQLRARIEVAIKHLGWVPSAAARALATQRTGTIGAIFPTVANELAKVALAAARERGLLVIPKCTFFVSYMRRHPDTQDLLAPEGRTLLEAGAPP